MQSKYIIFHNPRCSKSREALKILVDNNIQPVIHLYLEQKLSVGELENLLILLGKSVKNIIRTKEKIYKELSLQNANDVQILKAISENPILLERPIIKFQERAVIGRPPEEVFKLIK